MAFPMFINGSLDRALQVDTVQGNPIGALMVAELGRKFRYARIPASTTLIPGNLYQCQAVTTAWQSMALSTQAADDNTVTVTLGATAVAANELAGGFFFVDVPGTAANGSIAYRIASHPAAAASATCVLTLECGLGIAIAAADTGSVYPSKYQDVIIHPSPPTQSLAGVALSTAVGSASSTFAWLQTAGPCSVLTNGTLVVGTKVMPSDAVDGAVEQWVPETDTAGEVESMGPIGVTLLVEADTEYSLIDLAID